MNVIFFRPSSKPSRWLTKRSACLPWWSLDRTRWSRGSPHLLTTATGRITYALFYLNIFFTFICWKKSVDYNWVSDPTWPNKTWSSSRVDSAPHSATSLSSNNSSATSFTAGIGHRPAPYGPGSKCYWMCHKFFKISTSKDTKRTSKVRWTIFLCKLFLYGKRFLYAKRSSFPAIKLEVIFTFGKIWFRLWNSLSMQGFFYLCLIALLFNRCAKCSSWFASSQATWELTPRKWKLAYHLWAWNGMWMYLSMRLVEVYISV